MTASRIDRILLALGTLLILISSYQLFFQDFEGDSGLKLGTLTSAQSIVKTKSAVALDWRDAARGIDVTENQLIYTDNASSAEVQFVEGNSLEIGENSLVKLRSSENEQGMDVSKGFIRARLEGNKPIKVQMNGEDYLLSGENADVQINIQKSKGEIGVLSGEVKLQTQGVTESLTPETAMEIDGTQLKKKSIAFKTLSPAKNESIYVGTSPSPVVFSWSPEEEAAIKISRKPDLEKARTENLTSGASLELTPGLWYYRIENSTGHSLINSFRVILETPPKILRPRDGEEVSLLEDKIVLQWMGEKQDKFILEWNDGESHSIETEHTSAVVNVKSGVPFRWRVKIANENRPLAIWSEWQNISVNVVPVPVIPTNLIPNDVEYQAYEKPDERIELNWNGEGSFELELQEPDGNMITRKLGDNSFVYQAKLAGNYQWRVRSIDNYLRISEWSPWSTFKIEDLSGEKEAEGIQRIQLKRPDQSVTFNWKAEKGTTSVFELAKDVQFKTIVKKVEITNDQIQVSVPEVGAYYWRSRQYKPDGSFEVSEPKRVIIEPVPAPEKPEKLPDFEIELETLPRKKTSFIQHIFDFIIPSAHADESSGVVKLELPVKEEAKGYIVRIYRDADLSDLVHEETISSKNFVWSGARTGEYYLQYAVIDFWERTSLFSDPSRLIVKQESFAPEKPRLLSPIRAVEIDQKDLVLRWTSSQFNQKYVAEISDRDDFKTIKASLTTTDNFASFSEYKLEPKLHYWRVRASNKEGEVLSNSGRFVILPPLEKKIFIDRPQEYRKVWKSRAFLGWAPSMDSYKFKDGDSGTIDGNAMMGFFLNGTLFRESFVFNAEVIRQTGEVFKSEKYLFQRGLVDAIYLFGTNPNHKWGVGAVAGQTSAFGYTITDGSVKSESVSAMSYGATFRNYYSVNEKWDLQGKLHYLMGDITTMELGGDAIYNWKGFLILGGATYSSREYKVSEGKQTSIRLSFGIGKEF